MIIRSQPGASHFRPNSVRSPVHKPRNANTRLVLWTPVVMSLLLPALAIGTLLGYQTGEAQAASARPLPSWVAESGLDARSTDVPGAFAALAPPVQFWSDDIRRWSGEYGLDPNLIAALMQIESCGHPSAVSGSGALGLFQVMPYHFHAEEDPLDPDTNARRGLSYLARALTLAAGNTELALAGYNGGHGVIPLEREGWPLETVRFVRWGGGILQDLQHGETQSATLQAWLAAGGHSLCSRAATELNIRAD